MKIPCLSLLLLCAMVAESRAGDFSGKSPSGKIAFRSQNEKRLYVSAADSTKKEVLVYTESAVSIHSATISPDDRWIALEQGGSSLGHTILFFRSQKGLLDFKPDTEGEISLDPAEQVGTLALQSKGIKENILDHCYLSPGSWTADSKWLTVSLNARGRLNGKNVVVSNWECLFNPVTREVQPSKGNHGKVEIGAKGS